MRLYKIIYLLSALLLLFLASLTDPKWISALAAGNLSSPVYLLMMQNFDRNKDTEYPFWLVLSGACILPGMCAVILGASLIELCGSTIGGEWKWALMLFPFIISGSVTLRIIMYVLKQRNQTSK